mmetsp:Transcript_64617/g.168039  ORF Transcript_64617/g.168039 Transcript_64617/m.168039 type:complete len:398 (+) Transcript_64617:86-1279(+)
MLSSSAFLLLCLSCTYPTLSLSLNRYSPGILEGGCADTPDPLQVGLGRAPFIVNPDYENQSGFLETMDLAFGAAHGYNNLGGPNWFPSKESFLLERRVPAKKKAMTINLVISLTNETLPHWAYDIVDGKWGADVSVSAYVKTPGLSRRESEEGRVLRVSDRLEMIAIPDVGRNEHAYVWHLARKAPSFADVEIFTKTNGANCHVDVREVMVKTMVDVARNGTYGSVSYPWEYDRRYLQVRCDSAWADFPLYHAFCESGAKGVLIPAKSYKNGSVPLYAVTSRVTASKGPADLSFALSQLKQPLPFIHETYGEGMFSVRRDVLNKFSDSWYRDWRNITYAASWGAEYDGHHHDQAMMDTFPLLFARASEVSEFPAWFVSTSTVDLFDRVDLFEKFKGQ